MSVLWTPSALAVPPGVWLDAAAGVGVTAGKVSAWPNLGTVGGNFSAVEAYRPDIATVTLGGQRAVVAFAGGDAMVGSASMSSLLRNVGAAWMFLVVRKTALDGAATSRRVMMASTSSFSAPRTAVYWDDAVGSSANRLAAGARRLDGDSYNRAQSSATQPAGTWKMVLAEIVYTARTIRLHIDGALDAETTNAFTAGGNTSDTDSAQWTLCGSATGGSSFVGDLAMAMAGAGSLLTTDIDRIFGWAAHRYGLAGSLPGGHPYKSAAPSLGPLTVLSSGLALDEVHGADTLRVNVKRRMSAESEVAQRARVSLLRQRDLRVFRRSWSDGGVAVFDKVNASQRYIALAEYPTNPDNPAAEDYLRPVAGVSLKRGESA